MRENFPYQVVAFLGTRPELNEPVYSGSRGWFAQIALKRRFTLDGSPESEVIDRLKDFCETQEPLDISVGGLIKPERMPVYVLEVEESERLMKFHLSLIKALGPNLISRYPERDGDNYLPHVTAEYGGKFVIDSDKYKNRGFTLARLCLLKDIVGDSVAQEYFGLKG